MTHVPYLSLSKKHLPNILAALELKPESVLYELGCGDGRIVIAGAVSQPSARCVGIEYALAPILMARLAHRRAGKLQNVVIRKENFFKTDLSEATHIFCYLYPKVMADLHEKFKKELRPGTRVVACDFPIESKIPLHIVPLVPKTILGKNLYVYTY